MNSFFKRIWNPIRNFLGLRRHTSYERSYLNTANIRMSLYMSFIIIAVEIWMIIRGMVENVIPTMNNAGNTTSFMELFFMNTSQYWLFLFAAASMLTLAINFLVEKSAKFKEKWHTKKMIVPLVFSIILIIFSFSFFNELKYFKAWDLRYNRVSNLGVIFLYLFAFLLGLSIVIHIWYNNKYGKKHIAFSILTLILFSAMCLAFGVKVGYTDFFSRFYSGTGLPKEVKGEVSVGGLPLYEIKSIICFLTMVTYVGALLIWKPYISILMLTFVFGIFGALLNGDPANRVFADGDKINYITFYISLTIIAVSIYQQRISEAKKSENLEYRAKYDTLTPLHNYGYYVGKVGDLLKTIPDKMDDYCYIFINIQNFKTYNDQMGFEEGTKFLINFAKKIKELFGKLSAREADDHFVAFDKREGLEEKINELNQLIISDAHGLYLNLKVGIVKPISVDEDINTSVDRARYAALTIKNIYSSIIAEYDDRMHDIYKKKQYVVNHLDEAIEKNYIKVYYQPVVWSSDRKLCGCEALARWIDPKYGFLSPGDFIPVLEEVKLIHKLDAAIFELVCKDLRNSLDAGKPVVPVSLNFSRLDFELMDAVKVFEDLIEKYQIPKDYVHVEITESALNSNLELLQSCMDKLSKDGFSIWLDDFGSGYSSLNVLKDFHFDVLKIDMKFLTNFEKKPVSKVILDAIIKLSEKIGMLTLTEGVETQAQADFLSEIGCGRLQGYLFGKPLPIETLEEDIKNGKYIVSDEII